MSNTNPHNRCEINIRKKDRPSRSEPNTDVSEKAQMSYINFCREKGLKVMKVPDFPRMYTNHKEVENA